MPREITQSERDLSSKVTKVRLRTNTKEAAQVQSVKPRPKTKTTTMILSSTSESTTDVVRAPLNWQLVDQTVSQLQKASDDLVQLYKRISLDYEMEDAARAKMLQKLAFMAGVSQQTLKPVNPTAVLPELQQQQQPPYVYSNQKLPNQGPSWC